jgi:hypothetical protein
MAGKEIKDLYTSRAVLTVTESAGNTLTWEKLETGLSVYDKIGWVISKIKWTPYPASYAQFNSSGDTLSMNLTMSNNITTLSISDPAIYAQKILLRTDLGTAASGAIRAIDFEDDFSTLPGGGLMVLPNPLYLGVQGTGLAAACTVSAQIFFQAIQLSDQDYFNMFQARQILINS